jgi:Xaa-Pro aminopeptidase
MMCFETLTLAPIDRNLVEPSLLDDEEIDWLDAYHARVRGTLTPLVDPDTARWLAEATAPIPRLPHPSMLPSAAPRVAGLAPE